MCVCTMYAIKGEKNAFEHFDNRTRFVSKMEALKCNGVSWEVNDDLSLNNERLCPLVVVHTS